MLDGVLFEPGEWEPDDDKILDETVPANDRSFLSTSLGLLFNEIRYSSDSLIRPIEKMVYNILELDTGRFSESSSPAALYVIRLTIRVYSYIDCLVKHSDWKTNNKQDNITKSLGSTYIRGLEAPDALIAKLRDTLGRWRLLMLGKVLPMLSTWLRRCTENGNLSLICIIRSHLGYIFKETDWVLDDVVAKNKQEQQMLDLSGFDFLTPSATSPRAGSKSNKDIVFDEEKNDDSGEEDDVQPIKTVAGLAARTLLCTQVFLTASYRVVVEPKLPSAFENGEDDKPRRLTRQVSDNDVLSESKTLGIDELELFALFQKHRSGLLNWLLKNQKATNELMEYTVHVLVHKEEEELLQQQIDSKKEAPTQRLGRCGEEEAALELNDGPQLHWALRPGHRGGAHQEEAGPATPWAVCHCRL